MSSTLLISVIAITLALVFYTIGVFAERRRGTLTSRHVLFFWAGLVCDALGTHMMQRLAGGTFTLSAHSITGAIALVLMAAHAGWATQTRMHGTSEQRERFHKFSLVVWLIWLVPYISGMIMGMRG